MSELADTVESGMARSAFEHWVDAARPKAQLWRLAIGIVIVFIVSQAFVLVAGFAYALQASLTSDDPATAERSIYALVDLSTIPATLVALFSFAGLWLGVWIALLVVHGRQTFFSLFSPERRMRWGEFGIGVGIIGGYLLLGVAIAIATGQQGMGRRNDISVETWLLILAPMALATFVQACGEELVFRGYIMQHLAARFSNLIVAALLPSMIFGAIHYFNGDTPEYSWFYVANTLLFGLIAAATVWRTGSIAVAMGMHFANNLAGFMIAGPDDMATATPLYLDSVDNVLKGAPMAIAMLVLLLAFVLSPWAPMPKAQPFPRRNETRAAP